MATRQPHKLEIVGSSPALATNFLFWSLMDKVEVKNWRISVEPAKPGAAPVRKVMWTPGPMDLKAYDAGHDTSYEASHEVKKP